MWRLLWTLAVLIVSVRSGLPNYDEFESKHCYLDTNLKTTAYYFPQYDIGEKVLDGYVCENFTLTKNDLDKPFYFTTRGKSNIFMKNCVIEYFNNVFISKFVSKERMYFDNCKISLRNVDIDYKAPLGYRKPLSQLGFQNCNFLGNLNNTALDEFRDLSELFIQNSTFQYPLLDEYLFTKDHFIDIILIDNTNIKSIQLPQYQLSWTSSDLHEINSLFNQSKYRFKSSSLVMVSFANNSLTKLPAIRTLEQLRWSYSLNLSGNKITKSTLKGDHLEKLHYVTNLDLSRNTNISAISYLAFEDTYIQNLNMSSVNLKSLKKLGETIFITIDFSHNKISNIGFDVFENLIYLKHLNMSHNTISKLEGEVFKDLGNLTDLRLNSNHLGELEKDVFKGLFNISYLDISHNRVSKLDGAVFESLGNLKDLRLNSNNLKELPKDIFKSLKKLQFLDLSNNAIKKIHGLIYQSPIQQLILRNNSLTVNPSGHSIPDSLIPFAVFRDDFVYTNDGNPMFQVYQKCTYILFTMQIFLHTYLMF